MSSTFRVTPRAAADLIGIGRYTQKKWGKKQRDLYLRDLDRRFAWLAKNPKLAKHRLDINSEYYCYPQGAHLIFFICNGANIDIIGIPHKSMDVLDYFD